MPERLYSIIDVETTGGTPGMSRITDIAIFVTDGERILEEFSSLINPGMHIPGFITQLTGIDDDMVAGAPAFEEVARHIVELTEGTTFVAHNVNFDYGMIAGEFRRLGYEYQRPRLCTVKLSRQFIPGYKSYGLGKICSALGIPIHERHRARGDAEATVELFRQIMLASGGNLSNEPWVKALPVHLSRERIDKLPEGPGVYYFYNADGEVVYIGSSSNLFRKVTGHFTSKARKAQEMKSVLTDLDFEATGSELIARLKVISEVQKHAPKFNQVSQRKSAWEISASMDLFGYLHLQVSPGKAEGSSVLSFSTRKEGETYLMKLCWQYSLCGQLCGLKPSAGCQENTCLGACRQLEPAESHNHRVNKALRERSFSTADFVILEQGQSGEQSFVMIEDHLYVGYGSITSEDEGVTSLGDFKNHLTADRASVEKMAVIQAYMSKNKPRVIAAHS